MSVKKKHNSFMQNIIQPSSLIFLLINSYLFWGVLNSGWDMRELIVIYWMENVVIGMTYIMKDVVLLVKSKESILKSIATIVFFGIHYGVFLWSHASFIAIILIFSGEALNLPSLSFETIVKENYYMFGIYALMHGFFYIKDFIFNGEYKKVNLKDILFAPYSRIIVVHMFILICFFILVGISIYADASADFVLTSRQVNLIFPLVLIIAKFIGDAEGNGIGNDVKV